AGVVGMQDSDHFLKAAFQLGPWRVTRRVLLFITVFCAVIIIFGAIVLKTHMFDEDENFDWDDDDDDDDWEALDELSGGDAVMLVIIGLAAQRISHSEYGAPRKSHVLPLTFTKGVGPHRECCSREIRRRFAGAPIDASRAKPNHVFRHCHSETPTLFFSFVSLPPRWALNARAATAASAARRRKQFIEE
ncbi:hypothetical protein C7M84_004134, partial [Penaeus vannamei]